MSLRLPMRAESERQDARGCILVLALLSIALVARPARAEVSGTWTRQERSGGETWIYRFTVPDGPSAARSTTSSASERGARATAAVAYSGGTSPGSGAHTARRAAVGSASVEPGGATATVDLEAQRAYLNTQTAAAGTEVTTPSVGLIVYPHLDFAVSGAAAAVDISRRALIDGQTVCDFSSSTMNGDYITWCTESWVATVGNHTLRWDLDYSNTVAESNESNNSASTSWTSAASGDVDIVAERAYLNTKTGGAGSEVTTPVVGQTVYFHLDFSLVGSGGAVAISRRAVLDGQTFCDFDGAPTPGAYITWCTDAWTATAGNHTLRWDLDYDNTVTETNENNNSASTMWTSAPAGSVDLEAQRAYLRTMTGGNGDEVAAPSVGQTVYFYLDFRVVGSGDAIVEDRQATLDGQPYCGFTGTAPPGDYYAWCNDGWTATAGSHTLQWDLDFNHALGETNENNNSVSTTFTSGTGACGSDCNGDGAVTVNELITMVNIALGTNPVSTCSAGDANADGEITVNEIVAGVNHALSGCG